MSSFTLAAGGGVPAVQLDLLIVLACAGVVTMALSRLRVAAIPAYLLAGIAIGPGGLGLIDSAESVEQVGRIALIVLMFSIGMHLDSSSLRRGAASMIAIGLLTTLATTALGWAILSPTSLSTQGALAVAMALSMSSTAVVLKLIAQRREMHTTAGRVCLGVLLMQDLIVIGYLAMMPVLAQWQGGGAGPDAEAGGMTSISSVLIAIGGVGVTIVVGQLVLPRVLREASRWGGGEVLLVLTAAIGLGAALLTASLGLSPELGAFIAGFLLAGTPFKFQVSGQLAPLRDLFMAVFFTAVGLQVNLDSVIPVWWVIPVGVVGLILVKSAVISVIGWAFGTEGGLAARVGIALAQSGEFSLIVLALASEVGLIGPSEASVVVGVVIASLIVTPALLTVGLRLGPIASRVGPPPWTRGEGLREASESAGDGVTHVIVAGLGPIGRACVERLEASDVRVTIVEMNPETVRAQKAAGRSVVFGDISNPEVLDHAGLPYSDAVVLTFPDSDSTLQAVQTIRNEQAGVHIAVRVGTQRRGTLVKNLGADLVVVEESVTAAELANQVIVGCDVRNPSAPKPADEVTG